jgi:hypothetical protein
MNIVEATIAAQTAGVTCIARTTDTGYRIAVKPTNGTERLISAIYRKDRLLSHVFRQWSPRLSDLIADDWQLFNPAEFTITVTEPEVLLPEWISMPSDDCNFKSALKAATDREVYTAADILADKFKSGEKVKTRLKAVEAEIGKREANRIARS